MTDKIIIDGVDVSECENYIETTTPNVDGDEFNDVCNNCYEKFSYCGKNSNCLYKQLKRTQEKYETLTNKFFNSETDKTHLKQENEKLKKEVKQIGSSFIKKGDYARALEQENEKLKQVAFNSQNAAINITKQTEQYKSTLEDIKTLVTTDYIQNKKQLVQNYDCLDNFMQKIEDKCEEVL